MKRYVVAVVAALVVVVGGTWWTRAQEVVRDPDPVHTFSILGRQRLTHVPEQRCTETPKRY